MSLAEALARRTGSEESGRRIYGVVPGVVTGNEDPDSMGRVRVRFPWLSDDESQWARLAVPLAGSGYGTFFLPEVGDEVLIAFEHGNINRPFVVGSLWNGQDAPPESNADGENNIRMIRSRSGHEIVFDDNRAGSSERLLLKTNGGHQITLDDSSGSERIEILDSSGSNRFAIDTSTGRISISSDTGQLKLSAPTIEIDASAALKLKSGGVASLEGTLVKIN